jgi:hypothetical protein
VPAELAGQRPLLALAAAGDREAFARRYDGQVEGVYRYLLAWTGDRAQAAELTAEVFHSALAWLPATAAGEGEAGAWLTAMARDAVAQRRGSGWIAGPDQAPGSPTDVVAAVARLGDPRAGGRGPAAPARPLPGPHRPPLRLHPGPCWSSSWPPAWPSTT